MPVVTIKNLLEAGVHFGHQTRRWNPKMKPYIFTERNGIYILDLQRTLRELDHTYSFVRSVANRGGKVLMVGTKKQAQEPIKSEAERAGLPYVTNRWLGGMLTNFVTMRSRIDRMEELEAMEEDGRMATLPKKEQLLLRKELTKLKNNLDGVRDMKGLPGALFVVDTKRENIAVAEARRLKIPIIGLVDTNADPDEVDYVIPGNDDAIRSVALMCRVIADAAIDGQGGLIDIPAVEASPAPAPTVVDDRSAAAPVVESSAAAEAAPAAEVCVETESPAVAIAEVAEAVAPAPEAPDTEAPAAE